MTAGEHYGAADLLLQAASLLRQHNLDIAAGECLWGATVHAIDAIGHRANQNDRHAGNNRQRAAILAQTSLQDPIIGFTTVKDKLHNHFYTGLLSESDLNADVNIGFAFVQDLMRYRP